MESRLVALVEANQPRGKHRHHEVGWRRSEDNPNEVQPYVRREDRPEALALVSPRAEKPLHVQANREGNYEE